MSRPQTYAAALLAVLALLSLAFFSRRGDGETAAVPPEAGGARPPAVVAAAAAERGPFVERVELVGTLEARAAADLVVRSSGPVVSLAADVGDRVRKGQVLARIEPAEERQRVAQAQANLEAAEATLAQRRSAAEIAAATARRTAALFDEALVSSQQQDAAQAELAGAAAQVQLAQAQVAQARAALSAAGVELDQTLVVAPFDGVVGRRYLDVGAFAAQNSPVFQVADLSRIKTRVDLPERQAARVEVGQAATVTVPSLPGERFPARVARMSDVFDPQSNTTEAQVVVDDPDGRLKPGMFAQVTIALDRSDEALLVPAEAVVEDDGRSWVFVVEEKGAAGGAAAGAPVPAVARKRPVTVLGRSTEAGGGGRRLAVSGQLAAGDRVITLGHEALEDGAAIAVAAPAPRGAAAETASGEGAAAAPGAAR